MSIEAAVLQGGMAFDPVGTYVQLGADGVAALHAGGDRFWAQAPAELDRLGRGWLVSEYEFAADWTSWEMHPEADELVYLLSGRVRLLLDTPAGRSERPLQGRAAAIVPRGTWHTLRVEAPSRMLFVTLGRGTQHRPA